MADLPQNERAVLELVVIDELSVGEAAAVLGIRQGASRYGGGRSAGTYLPQHMRCVGGLRGVSVDPPPPRHL
jgi:hypothetical protein